MQPVTVNNDSIPTDESFHNCFHYFVQAIEVVALDATEQCEVMGNANVAWEVQHDAMDLGAALVSWPGGYLVPSEKAAIEQMLASLQALPQDVLSADDNLAAMRNPAWIPLRAEAAKLLVELRGSIERTCEFFRSDQKGREKGPCSN